MQIQFIVDWQVQLSRNLRLTAVNLKDLTSFYKDSLDIIHNRSNELFSKDWNNVEKNPIWAALWVKTINARQKGWWYYKKPSNNPWILRWTWRLQTDITKKYDNTWWVFAFNAPYAIYHHQWSWKLPKRAIIDLSNETNTKIIKALQKKINDDIKIFWKQK